LVGRLDAPLRGVADFNKGRVTMCPNMKYRPVLLTAVLIIGLNAEGWSQKTIGRFSGTVYDSAGKKLRNATLVVVSDQGMRYMTTSQGGGNFEFPPLPSGSYAVRICIAGLAPLETQSTIQGGQRTEQEFRLQPQSTTATAPQAPSQPPTPQNIQAAKLIRAAQPKYPEAARQRFAQGTVRFEAVIGTDGTITSLCIQNPDIDPDLAKAAVDAVSQWRYTPTLVDGMPAEVTTPLTVNFAFQ